MTTLHYDFSQVSLIAMGIPINHLADDGTIEVEYPDEDWEVKAGTNGLVIRSRKVNPIASAKIMLPQGSPDNDLLGDKIGTDRLLGTSAGLFQVADLNGTSLVAAPESWAKKIPNLVLGSDPVSVEYEFHLSNPSVHVGSNRVLVAV
jgi:hypothetical protein